MQFDTPLLFMIFNRPDTTAIVFEEIRKLKPARLFVAGDGPRPNKPGEAEKCTEARKIATNVDWPCEVKTLFREKNLGCKMGVSSAISWFFEHVEEGIILEDDCVPDPSFFQFCREMLSKYRDNSRIMHISGTCFQDKKFQLQQKESYYFSAVPNIWGWASWKRAWKLYDVHLSNWLEPKTQDKLKEALSDPAVYEYWRDLFKNYAKGYIDSWDGQWSYCCFMNKGLAATPSQNLITNIGYGSEATHTKNPRNSLAHLQKYGLKFPLVHPKEIEINEQADHFFFKNILGINATARQKIMGTVRRKFPVQYQKAKKLFHRK